MMGFLLILLSIVFLVIIIDWIPLFNTWQSRIKIGNFKNESDWENKVKTTAQKWLSNTPTIKLTDKTCGNQMVVRIVDHSMIGQVPETWVPD
ncbi:MAG: hypothetical protein K2P85_08985 [Flavobacteriaceae bacterium]|nr:hypothetical protein [Flavobacteriaceae bacterium]